ncbi:MAG: MBOAT family protein [Cytophagales bacterium]|nr:MBOAT family protein [Cytophagales bacterium]
MLFNSLPFIFVFLPLVFLVYFGLNRIYSVRAGKIFLLSASFFFYAYWLPDYLILLVGSILFNYTIARQISRLRGTAAGKSWLTAGVICNVLLLGVFKYTDFVLENINIFMEDPVPLLQVALPLAISFFTFQQIAYLVDSYKGLTHEYDFFNYSLFVSFFPQLIAGPIVHHKEMMPQFADTKNDRISSDNVAKGSYLFLMGLCKKIIIADSFAILANSGYGFDGRLSTADAWITTLAYTFQLYFDFSGYSDMAIGIGKMFNINIPFNFNSPYKATSIQDFWRRWHMTLSRFLKDYVYIPLGGNRAGEYTTMLNLFLTFLIGGIWHGAGWTFVIWGMMHGVGLIVHRLWQRTRWELPKAASICLTFFFAHLAWVFFRAETFQKAWSVLGSMFTFHARSEGGFSVFNQFYSIPVYLVGILLLFGPNTNELYLRFQPSTRKQWQYIGLALAGLLYLNSLVSSEFLYFDF